MKTEQAQPSAPSPTSAVTAAQPKPRRRRRRKLWRNARLVAIAWALLVLFGRLPDRFLLHPSTHRMDAVGAAQRFVSVGGVRTEFFVARPQGTEDRRVEGVVLLYPGNGTRAERVAQYTADHLWAGQPVEVWTMNHPGYGRSDGPARLNHYPHRALVAYDAMRALHPGRPVVVHGMSLGTTLALHVAAHRPVKGVVIQLPPPLRRLLLRDFGWWNAWLLAGPVAAGLPDEMDSLANAARCTAPAVFVVGTRDTFVPTARQDEVAAAYAGPKAVVRAPMAHVETLPPASEAEVQRELRRLIGRE